MKMFHSMSFRIALLSVMGVLLATIVLIISVLFSKTKTEQIVLRNKTQMEEQSIVNMKTIAHEIYNSIEIYDRILFSKLNDGLIYMHERFQATGNLEQISASMNFNINVPSPIVDDVLRFHEIYATIFRKLEDNSMVRISTNIIRDGKRFVNTKISPKNEDGSPNAMMQTVLQGKKYVGRANVGGEWVNAIYEPIIENGNITGMLFVGSLKEDTKNFIENLRDLQYGEKGSVFAVGSKGTQKGVLSISINGEMDNQNAWDLKNSRGEYYWQQIIESGGSLPTNTSKYTEVNYQNKIGQEYELAVVEMNYAPWDWVIGVSIPKEEVIKASLEMQESLDGAMSTLVKNTLLLGMTMFVLIVVISHFYAKNLTGIIKRSVVLFGEIGRGDMTCRLNAAKGEMGEMAKQFNSLMNNLQKFIKTVVHNSSNIATASEELFALSEDLKGGAGDLASKITVVASAIEQMSVNIKMIANAAEESSSNVTDVTTIVEQVAGSINVMAVTAEKASANANEVAGAAEQMSVNMNTITASVEEMKTSINQIANNANEAHKVANDAALKSQEATNAMNNLGIAAKEIGKVTDVIKKIADKTNLLALNATIEAASAGESGKGFAVVASEIKELANQSAKSADDITQRINGIQIGTGEAITIISNVSDIIVKINQSVEIISKHASQQTKASNEIANNIAQANIGTKRVAESISEVAKGSKDIAHNALQANTGAKRVAESMDEVANSSKAIAHNAGEAAKGASEVSQNIIGINKTAEKSVEGAKQVHRKSGDLEKIAEELEEVLSTYKT
jgi:methyl-accepting chemotaxis protein